MLKICFIKSIFTISLFYIFSFSSFAHFEEFNYEGCHKNIITQYYHCHKKRNKIFAKNYKRESFRYKSYKPKTDIGFYTQVKCKTNIDHVVSLKDAHDSGAKHWNNLLKVQFANDKENHVTSCANINSSKGASTPIDFLRKSSDGKGLEYKIKRFCSYLGIYYQVKIKYSLSFTNNNSELFYKCGFNIK